MKWTKKEDTFLLENAEKGLDYCISNLNRTKRAIQERSKTLKKKGIIIIFNNVKDKYKKENLSKIVKDSKTYKECLITLNITNFGSSYNTLKKYIKEYDLDTSHFLTKDEMLLNLNFNNSKHLDEILVENSTYTNRTSLKNKLYKEGLKKRKCEMCGQGEEWIGKTISLILDHKNGINNDNRIENLRIVCPNCNATLDTHCRKNGFEN